MARLGIIGGGDGGTGAVAGARPPAQGAVADAGHGQRAGAKRRRRRADGRVLEDEFRCGTDCPASPLADWPPPGGSGSGSGSGPPSPAPPPSPRPAGPGRYPDRRTGRGGGGAAGPVRRPPGCPLRRRCPRRARRRGPLRCGPAPGRRASRRRRSRAQRGDPVQFGVGRGTRPRGPGAAGGDPHREVTVGLGVAGGESDRVGLVGQPLADHLAAHRHLPGGVHVDGQSEPVQQLRAQLALLGVHRADQHEARLVRVRDPSRSMCTRPIAAASSMMSTRWSCNRLTSST